jgi:ribosomal-protein-alanine N-acetyltransferase
MFPDEFRTARLRLRPIVPGDAGAIFAGYAQDAEVTRFLVWGPHRTVAETAAYIARCCSAAPDQSRTYVLEMPDGAIYGAFDLRRAAPHRLEFGYVLARPVWGRGLMTEVLLQVVGWALGQSDIFRIGAVCDVANVASARVMEKSGLMRDGLLRRWAVHPNISDQPRDCLSYGIVR